MNCDVLIRAELTCEAGSEANSTLQEQRFTSAQVAWRQSEANSQRDAQLRHQAVQDRCLTISEELVEARAAFATERFEFEQDVLRLQSQILTSTKEADAMKLEERTVLSCRLAAEEFLFGIPYCTSVLNIAIKEVELS